MNNTSLNGQAHDWNSRSKGLGEFTQDHLVNRDDCYGAYRPDAAGKAKGSTVKKSLSLDVLIRHYRGDAPGRAVGLHTTRIVADNGSTTFQSRWVVVDVDHHGEGLAPLENEKAAIAWYSRLKARGHDCFLEDSNGRGGFHLWVVFKNSIPTETAKAFIDELVADWKDLGLKTKPEVFPKQVEVGPDGFGNWVRLPGRHPKHPDHWSRIFDGEDFVEGDAAINLIETVRPIVLTDLDHDRIRRFQQAERTPAPVIQTPKPGLRPGDERPDAARVVEALEFCKDFNDYDSWLSMGMCLNNWDPSDVGLGIWTAWSRQSSKYVDGACTAKWSSFSPGGSLTIRTLFKLAIDGGWDPSRAGRGQPSHLGGPLPGGNGTYAPAASVGITEEPWPELCLQEPPPGIAFPVDVFPVALQRYCQGVADVTLTPTDMAGCAMLATASAAIGQSISIQLRKTWRESALLYLLVVAPPGSTKTPTLKMVVNPLTKIDIRLRRESKESRAYWESQKKDLKKGEVAPEEPPQFRAIVKDITRETLAAILRDNPRGVLADPDEATAWVSSFNEYKAKGSDRQFWLSIWSSSSVSVDREGGRRSIFVKSPLVTVFGSLTPDMCGSLSEEHGRNDGFLDRILFAFPEVFPDQFWTEEELDDGDKFTWEGIIRELHGVAMIRTPEGELESHVIKFTDEAKAAYVAWYNKHVLESKTDNMPAKCQGVWSKFKGYSGRLILIVSRLRVAMDPERDLRTEPVNLADVQGGIRLIEYFKTQYLRIESEMTGGTGSPEALVVLRWIQRNRRTEFRVADIKSSLRRRFKTIASLQAPIRLLVEAGAIRLRKESTDEPVKSGPKPTATYEVNPKVLEEPSGRRNYIDYIDCSFRGHFGAKTRVKGESM